VPAIADDVPRPPPARIYKLYEQRDEARRVRAPIRRAASHRSRTFLLSPRRRKYYADTQGTRILLIKMIAIRTIMKIHVIAGGVCSFDAPSMLRFNLASLESPSFRSRPARLIEIFAIDSFSCATGIHSHGSPFDFDHGNRRRIDLSGLPRFAAQLQPLIRPNLLLSLHLDTDFSRILASWRARYFLSISRNSRRNDSVACLLNARGKQILPLSQFEFDVCFSELTLNISQL